MIILVSVPWVVKTIWKSRISTNICITFAVLAVVVTAVPTIDHSVYFSTPTWRAYAEVYPLYQEAFDYGYLPEQGSPIYEKLGWTDDDCNLFAGHFAPDEDLFSPDKVQTLVSLSRKGRHSGASWKITRLFWAVKDIGTKLQRLAEDPHFLAVSCLLLLLLPNQRKKDLITTVVMVFCVLLTLSVLVKFLKPAPSRVYYPLMLNPLLCALVSVSRGGFRSVPRPLALFNTLLGIVCLIAGSVCCAMVYDSGVQSKQGGQALGALIGEIRPSPRGGAVRDDRGLLHSISTGHGVQGPLWPVQLPYFPWWPAEWEPLVSACLRREHLTSVCNALLKDNVFLLTAPGSNFLSPLRRHFWVHHGKKITFRGIMAHVSTTMVVKVMAGKEQRATITGDRSTLEHHRRSCGGRPTQAVSLGTLSDGT